MSSNNYVFIMAGGVGSRFWPKSRNNFPKQFIDILGVGKSLLQLTYDRFLKLCPAENIYIVTNSQYDSIIKEQLPSIQPAQIICEPSRNNTAPCIGYASFKINVLNPDANIVVAPSDHFILYEDIFIDEIQQALDFTESNEALVTLGITPTRPDTGYGYIKYSGESNDGVHRVLQFREKPHLEKAQEFLAEGNYVWNAGIFVWKASSILKALKKHAEEIHSLFEKGNSFYNTEKEQAFIDEYYPRSPSISIDYAIMEQADNVYTIPAEFGWSDLGTWASLFSTSIKDSNNNSLTGENILATETKNCIIHIEPQRAAIIKGLDGYIVVSHENALLIYPKDSEQEIKERVKTLAQMKGDAFI